LTDQNDGKGWNDVSGRGPASESFVCAATEVADGRYLVCSVAGTSVLLCRSGGALSAIENRCSHQGVALAGGRLIGERIICPEHGAAFDVRTGKALSFPAVFPIRSFPLVERDGRVMILMHKPLGSIGQ